MRLYNTLTRTEEAFTPGPGNTVRIYTCGLTVYARGHIGNFRSFVCADVLRRTLRHLLGYHVKQVVNFTDVDDRTIAGAEQAGLPLRPYTDQFIAAFHEDARALGLEAVEATPRATDEANLKAMADLVAALDQKGLTYRSDGSVYFRIAALPGYGRLARLDIEGMKAGARVDSDTYEKENARDFVLWKAAKPGEPAWDVVEPPGRPGWHLECSAMAMELLGDTLDVHTGGVDLIFPHHEDEIAQSEGATGQPFSRFWCHGAFLLTEGSKMAKRVGNVWTVSDLRSEKISAFALRYFVFSTHYRKELNLVRDALDAAGVATRKLGTFKKRLEAARGAPSDVVQFAARGLSHFREALLDDLNGAEAVAALFTFVRQVNAALDVGGADPAALETAKAALAQMDAVLSIVDEAAADEGTGGVGTMTIPSPALAGTGFTYTRAFDWKVLPKEELEWLEERLVLREKARRSRDFAESDALRGELNSRGYLVEDSAWGPKVRKRV